MYIRIARESSVHPPYAAMMYCGRPDAANSVAPPYVLIEVLLCVTNTVVLSRIEESQYP